MKKIVFGFGLLLGSFFLNTSEAQVSVQVNIGGLFSAAISSQPNVIIDNQGYYDQNDYYYYPDINCYYDPMASIYYYPYNGGWMQSSAIPSPYRNYDFNGGRRVMMNQNQMAQRALSFNRGGNRDGYGGQQQMGQMRGQDGRFSNSMEMRGNQNRMAMNNRNQNRDNGRSEMGSNNRGDNGRNQMMNRGRMDGDKMNRR